MQPIPIHDASGVQVIAVADPSAINEGQSPVRQGLYALLDQATTPRWALDLHALDFISSSGIAFLIGARRRVEAVRGRLVLVGLRPEIRDLLRAMRLADLFEYAETEAQAIELLPPPPSL